MSSNEVNEVDDCDLDSVKELAKLFSTQFNIHHEHLVSPSKSYVVHLSQFAKNDVVGVGLEKSVILYDLANGQAIREINSIESDMKGKILGVKCSAQNENELFVCSIDGVNLFDVRTKESVNKFYDLEEGKGKPYSTFDVNSNGRIICAGTEEKKTDVFLSFFDIRKQNIIGAYWESHDNDISQIKFHPSNPNLLLSGGLDGLINSFDISEANEDDALQCTLNTDRSVTSLNWHSDTLISCITDSNEFMVYDLAEIELLSEFSRDTITERMRRNCAMECNVINCHNIGANGDEIALMASSNFNNGECLRTLSYNPSSKSLRAHSNFTGNRQIVRCSHYNKRNDYFLTGGEGGIITLWRTGEDQPSDVAATEAAGEKSEVGKAKKSRAAHKSKPY